VVETREYRIKFLKQEELFVLVRASLPRWPPDGSFVGLGGDLAHFTSTKYFRNALRSD